MKKFLATAAALMIAGAASAATVDFANEANTNGERGLADNSPLTIDGISMTLSATGGSAYLDAKSGGKDGGLGVCTVLTGNAQCNPSSDDNVSAGESVKVNFTAGATQVTDFLFRDANHNSLAGSLGLLNFSTDGVNFIQTTFANFMDSSVNFAASMMTFGYNDTQFYVSSFTASTGGGGIDNGPSPVPLPAAGFLLLGGLGAMGIARRRRKAA